LALRAAQREFPRDTVVSSSIQIEERQRNAFLKMTGGAAHAHSDTRFEQLTIGLFGIEL